MATTSVDRLASRVNNFISDMIEERALLVRELERLDALIATLTDQYPTIEIETERRQEETPEPPKADEPPLKVETGPRSISPRGENRDKVKQVLERGGEWTPKEIAQETGISEGSARDQLRKMVVEGLVVLVTEGKPPLTQSTYGLKSIFEDTGGGE